MNLSLIHKYTSALYHKNTSYLTWYVKLALLFIFLFILTVTLLFYFQINILPVAYADSGSDSDSDSVMSSSDSFDAENALECLASDTKEIVEKVINGQYVRQITDSELINMVLFEYNMKLENYEGLDSDNLIEASQTLKDILIQKGFDPDLVDAEVPKDPVAFNQVSDSTSASGSEDGSPYPQQGILDLSEAQSQQGETSGADAQQGKTSGADAQQTSVDATSQLDTVRDKEPSNKRQRFN